MRVYGGRAVLGRSSLFSRCEARFVRLEAGLVVNVRRLVVIFLAGFLRSRDELGVRRVGADSAAGLREKRQRALFGVELQQKRCRQFMK